MYASDFVKFHLEFAQVAFSVIENCTLVDKGDVSMSSHKQLHVFTLIISRGVCIGKHALRSHLFILSWCHLTCDDDDAPEPFRETPPSCTAHMYDH